MRLQSTVTQNARRHCNSYNVRVSGGQLAVRFVPAIQIEQSLVVVDGKRYAVEAAQIEFPTQCTHGFANDCGKACCRVGISKASCLDTKLFRHLGGKLLGGFSGSILRVVHDDYSLGMG